MIFILIPMLFLISPAFADLSCISQTTLNTLNTTFINNANNTLNETALTFLNSSLSDICGNISLMKTSLDNVVSLVGGVNLLSLQNNITNITNYINSGAINNQINNQTQAYLTNFTQNLLTTQILTSSLLNLTTSLQGVSNISAFRNDVNQRFTEFGHNYVTETEFQIALASLKNNITTQTVQPQSSDNIPSWAYWLAGIGLVGGIIVWIYTKFIRKTVTSTTGQIIHKKLPEHIDEEEPEIKREISEGSRAHIELNRDEQLVRELLRDKKLKKRIQDAKKEMEKLKEGSRR